MDEAPQRPPPPGRRAVPGLDREAAPGGCVSFPDGEACTAARSVRDSEQPDHRLAAVGAPPKRSELLPARARTRGAGDAESGPRDRLQPLCGYSLATPLAGSVRAVAQTVKRRLDLPDGPVQGSRLVGPCHAVDGVGGAVPDPLPELQVGGFRRVVLTEGSHFVLQSAPPLLQPGSYRDRVGRPGPRCPGLSPRR